MNKLVNKEFRRLAESVVSEARKLGVELKYDKQSIEWLDDYIERLRPELKQESYSGLATTLGAYVGETIIATYGGAWDYFEKQKQWGIRFNDKSGAFPASKIYKQLEDGAAAGDSILGFYEILPVVLSHEETERPK